MSGRSNIRDLRPLASRPISNIELTRAGFRRRAITKEESAEVSRVALNMRDYIDQDGALSVPETET
jgi:hypothetical protein